MGTSSVRYDNPAPYNPSPIASLLSGIIQGGAGQISLQQQQALAQQQAQAKQMESILPAFAQTNKLGFGQGGVGTTPFNYGGNQMYYDPSGMTASARLDQAKIPWYESRTNMNQNKDPDAGFADKIAMGAAAKAFDLTGDSSPEAMDTIAQKAFALRDSMAKQAATRAQSVNKFAKPSQAKKTVVKKQYSPDGKQTKLIYSDGTNDIVDGIQ